MSPPIPEPFLVNSWKHWETFQRQEVKRLAIEGHPISTLLQQLLTIGTNTMDVYSGELTLSAICEEIGENLQSNGHWKLPAYQAFLDAKGGYQELTISDASRWVCRMGEDASRYVHLHPARFSPNSYRIKSNSLKTVLLGLFEYYQSGKPIDDLQHLNELRVTHLGLSPMATLRLDRGLGILIARWKRDGH